MTWEAWLTLSVVLAIVALLSTNKFATDVVFVAGLTAIVTLGALLGSRNLPSPEQAITGFGNEGVVTVAILYVVVEGLIQTGAMAMIAQPLLGRPKSILAAQTRMMFPTAAISAFLNNTPVVAMFLPVVSDLCKKNRISPSKLFIPLSFATILGGLCTLIGTSTNIVVHGLLKEATRTPAGLGPGLGMFDVTWVGIPCALAGLAFIILTTRWLLPDRKPAISAGDDPRRYTVEMMVDPAGALVGQTIEAAGLRHLPGLFLMEIERDQQVIAAVSPHERLQGSDRLIFVGILESVVDLRKMRGLIPATNQVHKLNLSSPQRRLVEAVVSDSCQAVGKTIRESQFRSLYNAAVIAVARNGQRVQGKIGDIVLRPGDTLLLETHPSFADQQRNSRDFFLVSAIEGSTPPRHDLAWLALAILLGMVLIASFEWLSMLNAAFLAAVLMLALRCCSTSEARKSIDWEVLVVIGAALGIGKAMQSSGVAAAIASNMISAAGDHPFTALAVIYFVTMVLTELMSNNAAAALVFPIAMSTAKSLGVDFMPFVIAIMVAASCGFATPIGYQTHLMVYGPGGYRFRDFLRIGIPLDLLIMAVTITVTPLVWPFHP